MSSDKSSGEKTIGAMVDIGWKFLEIMGKLFMVEFLCFIIFDDDMIRGLKLVKDFYFEMNFHAKKT